MIPGGFTRSALGVTFALSLGVASGCAEPSSESEAKGGSNGTSAGGGAGSGEAAAGSGGAPNGGASGAAAGGGAGGAGAAAGVGSGGTSASGGAGGVSGEGGTAANAGTVEAGSSGANGEAGAGAEAGAGGESGAGGYDLPCHEDLVRAETIGRTADGSVEFELERCMNLICGGGCPVSSVYLRVVYAGRTDEAWDEQIDYTQTHHNWYDSLTATLPERSLRWHVRQNPDAPGEEHLVGIDATDGSPILEELVVPSETQSYFMGEPLGGLPAP